MKDASLQLRAAYYALLTDVLSLPVYDGKADDIASGNYVILTGQTMTEDSTKDTFEYEHQITVDIVTRFKGNVASTKAVDVLSDTVIDAVRPTPTTYGLSVDGFRVLSARLESKTMQAQFGTEYIARKQLTFTHLLTEQ